MTDEPAVITATEASRSFSDMLHRVCYGGESFVIKKGQRLMARIVPVDALVEVPVTVERPEPVAEALPVKRVTEAPVAETSSAVEYFKAMIEEMGKQPA